MAKTIKCEHCNAVPNPKPSKSTGFGFGVEFASPKCCQRCWEKEQARAAHERALAEAVADPSTLLRNRHNTNEQPDCHVCFAARMQLEGERSQRLQAAVWARVRPLFAALPAVMPLCFAAPERANALLDTLRNTDQSYSLQLEIGTCWEDRCSVSFQVERQWTARGERAPTVKTEVSYGSCGSSDLETTATRIAMISKALDFMQVVRLNARAALGEAERAEEQREKSAAAELKAIANQGPGDRCSGNGCWKTRKELADQGRDSALVRRDGCWICPGCLQRQDATRAAGPHGTTA